MKQCAFVALALLFSCGADGFPDGRWVDLTHAFDEDTIYWPTAGSFQLHVDFERMTEKGYWYASKSYSASEHGGTHIDAPYHFAQGKQTAEAIPLQRLIAPAAVVDVSDKCEQDADYLVRTEDLEAWEARHGRIERGWIVLLNTGFHRRWPDRTRYMGTDERGPEAVEKLHFPGLHPEAARWLVRERKIAAVGIDTPSIDYGQSGTFDTHRALFEHDVPAFENVANLGALPPRGARVFALPMKIRRGTGGPLRIVALVPGG